MSDLGLTHIALAVADLDASIAFYGTYAGTQLVHRRPAEEGEGGVAWVSDMTRPFVIVLAQLPGVKDRPLGPFGHLGVACKSREEVDRLVSLAKQDGCLIKGPEDYGPPVGYWAYIADPDGNTLEVSYGQDVGLTVKGAKIDKADIPVRDAAPADKAWIAETLEREWGGAAIALHGEMIDALALPAIIAGEHAGLLTYRIDIDRARADIVTVNSFSPGRYIGTALIDGLILRLRDKAMRSLHVTTTNDNVDALRFYQRRGFCIEGIRPGALADSRKFKPTIPATGAYGIALRDEIDLVRELA